jgi:hypothetical protein
MSNSSGIVAVVKKGLLLPEAFQQKLLQECPNGFSFSVADSTVGLASLNLSPTGIKDKKGEIRKYNISQSLTETVQKFKDRHLVLYFYRHDDPGEMPEIARQPFPLIEDNGKVLLHAFAEGEFSKYANPESEYPPEVQFMVDFFGDYVNQLFEECGNDLNKLFEKFHSNEFRISMVEHMAPTGMIYLHDKDNHVCSITCEVKDKFGVFDWGITSNTLGYTEEKKAEPEPVKKTGWAAKRAAKAEGGQPSVPSVPAKEVPTEKVVAPKSDEVKPSEKVEGGTPVTLPTEYGVIDGRVVRPPLGKDGRDLKDWYKAHDQAGCPQNFRQARPGIPFDRLTANSHIRRILEGTHFVPPAKDVGTKYVDATSTRPTSTGLTPKQVEGAVSIHKKATYVVDPEQFKAAEKDRVGFFERTQISLGEFAHMSEPDKQALLELGGMELVNDLLFSLNKWKPELLKYEAAKPTVTEEKKPEEKAPAKTGWAAKRAARTAA